jgi:hypothetical protein
VIRADLFLDEFVQGTGRFHHFAGNQFAKPGWTTFGENASDETADVRAKPFLGIGDGVLNPQLGRSATTSVIENRPVELLFVAEIVVDGSDVRPSPLADVANGGMPKPKLSKDFSGDLDESLSGLCGNITCDWHDIKPLFNTYV